jgi:hypothetical protein
LKYEKKPRVDFEFAQLIFDLERPVACRPTTFNDLFATCRATALHQLTIEMESNPPGKIIDENTKLGDLTDLEIADLTQRIKHDEAASKPLVGLLDSIITLVEEYEGATTYSRKIDTLEKSGWNKIRRTRGDGDCWYRSIVFLLISEMELALMPRTIDRFRIRVR